VDYDLIAELIGRELGTLLVLWFALRYVRRRPLFHRALSSAIILGIAVYFARYNRFLLLGNVLLAIFVSLLWLFRPLPPLAPSPANKPSGRFVRALLRRS
jgi:hypothetical protein